MTGLNQRNSLCKTFSSACKRARHARAADKTLPLIFAQILPDLLSNPKRRSRQRLFWGRAASIQGNSLCWRRGQDSNLQALSGGGFQDRCITIMLPLRDFFRK